MNPTLPPILASALFVAGCMVGPNYEGQPNVDHTPTFAGSGRETAPAAIDHWWRQLRSKELDRFVHRAFENNHDVGIATQRLREARALRRHAGSALLPAAGTNINYTRMNIGSLTGGGALGGAVASSNDPEVVESSLSFWSSGLDLSWEIDVFGGTRRNTRAAAAREQAAAEALNGVRQALAAEVTETYYLIAGLRGQLSVVNAQVELQQAQVDDVQTRVTAGASSQLDLDRVRSRLEITREQVPTLENGIVSQRKRLALLLGAPPDALDTRQVAAITLPAKLPMTRTGLPADLIMRRPDLRQSERNLAAATEDIGVATANFYPKFVIGNTGPIAFATRPGDLFNASNYVWQFGPRVEWSLFSGGANRAMLEKANASAKAALLEFEKSVLVAIGEVESELANLKGETQRLAIIQRALSATQDAVRRIRENHEAGALAAIDVLIEEANLRNIEIAEIRAKNEIIQVWIRLHKALGGGWK